MTTAARDIQRTRDPSKSIPQPARRRRGRRARPHAAGHARRARGLARGDRGRPGPPAPVRGRRLARAAHAADLDPRQPRAADRRPRRRARRGRALGAALLAADAPPRRRPAAARPRRRQPPAAARADRHQPGARRGGVRARSRRRRPPPDRRRRRRGRRRRPRRALPHDAQPHGERDPPHAGRHAHPRAGRPPRTARSCSPCRTTGRAWRPSCASRIFERFVRGAGDRGSSSGLGLSIVRAVAESHGGSVVLEDADPGARFVVRLPGGRRPGARARGRLPPSGACASSSRRPATPAISFRWCRSRGRASARATRSSIATHAPRADNVERLGLPVHPIAVAPDAAWAPLMGRLPGLPQSDGDALIIAEGFARIGAGGALPGFLAVVEQWRPERARARVLRVRRPDRRRAPRRPHRRASRSASPPPRTGSLSWPRPPSRTCAARRASRAEAQGAAALLSIVPPGLDDGPAERFRDAAPPAPQPLADWWEDADAPLVYVTLGSVTGSLPPSTPASTAACSMRWRRWRSGSC